jgi:AcrR family transcriptional regulator
MSGVMSNSYESYGRANQKRRTRADLMAAAAELLQQGITPSIAQTAEAAGVSRSTAYRYFPSQDVFLAEVLLTETVKLQQAAVFTAAQTPGTGEERLAAVIKADHALVITHERAYRKSISVLIAAAGDVEDRDSFPRRPGNRLRYLAQALEPFRDRLSEEQRERLVMVLACCTGLESIVVLKDICGLRESDAEQVKLWAANALLQATLREESDPA